MANLLTLKFFTWHACSEASSHLLYTSTIQGVYATYWEKVLAGYQPKNNSTLKQFYYMQNAIPHTGIFHTAQSDQQCTITNQQWTITNCCLYHMKSCQLLLLKLKHTFKHYTLYTQLASTHWSRKQSTRISVARGPIQKCKEGFKQ